MSRRTLLLAVLGAVIVASAAVLAIEAIRGDSSLTRASAQNAYRGSSVVGRFELPRFALRDQDGRLVTARELRGHVLVLTFIDTDCKESCPVIAGVIGSAMRRLEGPERQQVRAVAISVNPEFDTPTKVRQFLRERRAQGTLDYLVGSLAELRPVWHAFKILSAYETGDANLHSAPVRVYDANGVWVSTLHAGADLSAANLVHDVRQALKQ